MDVDETADLSVVDVFECESNIYGTRKLVFIGRTLVQHHPV
jgi:hypothetical protein